MSLIIVFIEICYNYSYYFSRFVYVPSPHMKDVLDDVLVDCLLEWNIDRKLSIITVDNYSTNDVMIRLLLNKFDTSSLMLSGYVLYIRCAEHILNFIVQDELSLIGDAIERIHDNVIYQTTSSKRRQKFDENACQLRIQAPKSWSQIVRHVGIQLT